ncbi:MAG: hypothetical protein ABSD20_22235 [Terriglobales bacterium]|jgi:hypothetical protein
MLTQDERAAIEEEERKKVAEERFRTEVREKIEGTDEWRRAQCRADASREKKWGAGTITFGFLAFAFGVHASSPTSLLIGFLLIPSGLIMALRGWWRQRG